MAVTDAAILRGVLVASLLTVTSCTHTSGDALAFTRVNVVTMSSPSLLEDQDVLVERGRITAVGNHGSIRIPDGTRTIEGNGRYLAPGLVDAHVHLRDSSELLSYLFHGVTTVIHLSGPAGNVRDVLALRDDVERGNVLGPRIYTTGRNLDGRDPIFPGVSTAVTTPEEARAAVAAQDEAGVDFIKVYNNLEPEVHRAVVDEAHRRGLAVVGHIPRRIGRAQALQAALDAGQDMIAHAEELFFTYFYDEVEGQLDRGEVPSPDRARIANAVAWIRDHEVAVTPNLSFVAMTRRLLDDPEAVFAEREFRHLHPIVRTMWRGQNPSRRRDRERFDLRERGKYPFLQHLVRELQTGGVPLLLGSDASAPGLYPGRSAHLELEELVAAGLTPFEALATGTRSAGAFVAKHVRGAARFGTIAPGQSADLILVSENPLANIRNLARIEGVVVRGTYFTRDELGKMRDDAAGGSASEVH